MAELKTFVFTDISGSVRLKDEMAGRSVTERDQAFISSILTPHRQRIEAQLAEHGGRVVSTAGDGHFLVFDHTVQAAQWAVAVQESHRDAPITTPKGERVEVRMSMHVGVPQIDPGDPNNFVGKTVDYAARLNDYATGGQILVSRSVMAILDDVGLEGVRLHMQGRRNLKGIGSVEVHELVYDDHGPRPMRNQPKTDSQRQWTVVPTQGMDSGYASRVATVAGETALKRVGNYELEELLGAGGMGDVYKARHTQFGRVRAVKVIKPQFVAAGHTEVIRRFYNEVKAAGRLEHKNIVVAIDSSSPSDTLHYLVMEYVDGVSLEELVATHGPLPIADACEIVRQAARGLQYIHKNNMVHRDIKPSNIMVTLVDAEQIPSDSTLTQSSEGPRAVVKILDLGLALLAADSERLTRLEHKAMGTGMYMSPEQWKTTSVDIRADIYSLGCTLYHLLAGNPPFYESDLRPERAHEKSAVPPIRTSVQPLPKKLWDVLRKTMEKRPEDRYATPAEVSAALAPFAEGHNLPGLVLSHQSGETVPAGLLPTKPNGSGKTDTHRSRPWFSGGGSPARRLLERGLPLALLLLFVGGAFWFLRESWRQEAERSARANLPAFARTAATGKLAAEIETRFAKLKELSQDPNLVKALRNHLRERESELPRGALPRALPRKDAPALEELNTWISTLTHTTGINVDSWFVTDDKGYQVARSPKEDSVGQRYQMRDYFHGLGRSLGEDEDAQPIQSPHLSTVYRSSTSNKLKVAFSTPIWDQPESNPQVGSDPPAEPGTADAASTAPFRARVLGVLAMTVNVAEFEVLESDQQGGNEVVLIDLRNDEIEGTPKRGLILHHPSQKQGELKRIDEKLLTQILEAQPFSRKFRSEESFLSGYSDPFNPDQLYWGAFQPIVLKALQSQEAGGSAPDSGWIVLVQVRMN
jgi:serine/threonine protein kinase/class 3 adenylate cyclase